MPPLQSQRLVSDDIAARSGVTDLGRRSMHSLSKISFVNTSSISQMMKLARAEPQWGSSEGRRYSGESVLSDEVHDLVRMSESHSKLLEKTVVDEMVHGVKEVRGGQETGTSHAVKEIRGGLEMKGDMGADRVSALRFADLNKNGVIGMADDGDIADAQLLLRLSNGSHHSVGLPS
mmetsp:Transcript_23892/g.36332  ORF Transcript_23892/g.36332 Transcript_23892/m.36332 type:complete len:176 (-) Transcript_23892:125-652(-)